MGRINIAMEVLALVSFIAMPCEGHLQQVLQIFAYLKIHQNTRIVFDHTFPNINMDELEVKNWSSMYRNEKQV